ncbi:hypothetical protein BJ875DRAFT_520803, partial [Amylocarpus encephaloides]
HIERLLADCHNFFPSTAILEDRRINILPRRSVYRPRFTTLSSTVTIYDTTATSNKMSSPFILRPTKAANSMEPLAQIMCMFPDNQSPVKLYWMRPVVLSAWQMSLWSNNLVLLKRLNGKFRRPTVKIRAWVNLLKVKSSNVVPDKKYSASVKSSLLPNGSLPETILNLRDLHRSSISLLKSWGSTLVIEEDATSPDEPSEGFGVLKYAIVKPREAEEADLVKRSSKSPNRALWMVIRRMISRTIYTHDTIIKLKEANVTKPTYKAPDMEGPSEHDLSSQISYDDQGTTVRYGEAASTKKRKRMIPDEEFPKE